MPFRSSSRLPWATETNPLARALTEARRAATPARPLIDLTISNPTQAQLPWPADPLAALSDPAGRDYQPTPRGSQAAREAVSASYEPRCQGVWVDFGHVLVELSVLRCGRSHQWCAAFVIENDVRNAVDVFCFWSGFCWR